jgi:hypothetical protein
LTEIFSTHYWHNKVQDLTVGSRKASFPAFFISIILGSVESDLYWSVGATFIQIIDESAFIHPNVCTFIQNRAIPP